MRGFDFHFGCVQLCEQLGIPLSCWTPQHTPWGATCADRMAHSPATWLETLTMQAAEAMFHQLMAQRTAEQAADLEAMEASEPPRAVAGYDDIRGRLDPEVTRITPPEGTEILYRPLPDPE